MAQLTAGQIADALATTCAARQSCPAALQAAAAALVATDLQSQRALGEDEGDVAALGAVARGVVALEEEQRGPSQRARQRGSGSLSWDAIGAYCMLCSCCSARVAVGTRALPPSAAPPPASSTATGALRPQRASSRFDDFSSACLAIIRVAPSGAVADVCCTIIMHHERAAPLKLLLLLDRWRHLCRGLLIGGGLLP
jgi:hypothetical protein